jgi:hypothetical protein
VTTTLLTVAGRSPTDVYAVGGPPTTLLHYDGTQWSKVEGPESVSGLTGVSAAADGTVYVVGLAGTRWRMTKEQTAFASESDQPPRKDFHAVWAGGAGSAWAVGGDFTVAGSPGVAKKGVVAYLGSDPPPAFPTTVR